MQLETWMLFKPRLNVLCLVRRIVIDDQMQIEMSGHSAVDFLQKAHELLCPMARQALANDLSGLHVQSSKQRCCAVTLVVVCHCGRTALLYRQARLRAVERLNLAFLVDAEHQRLVRRVHVEADDVCDLFGELRIAGQLDGFLRDGRVLSRSRPSTPSET